MRVLLRGGCVVRTSRRSRRRWAERPERLDASDEQVDVCGTSGEPATAAASSTPERAVQPTKASDAAAAATTIQRRSLGGGDLFGLFNRDVGKASGAQTKGASTEQRVFDL